ncbi:MAG: hypothetical protein J6D08_06225 [Lachnospiraceae bacterium]|nr:hypothetical protein [Lachnospiraceae bacterium]
MSEKDIIQWHPAFCSAVRLELKDHCDILTFEQEYNLNQKPLQVDLLIIKMEKHAVIKNDIGRIFRGHNIMEYKSPSDSLDIDTYFKVLGYACLYKAYERSIGSIRPDDITISFVRDISPARLMRWFQENGYTITQQYSGIYYIQKDNFFQTQIIVTCELNPANHKWLSKLTNRLSPVSASELITDIHSLSTKHDKDLADSLFQVALKANPASFYIVKEDSDMCEALMELMKPEFDAALSKAVAENTQQVNAENTIKSIDNVIHNLHVSLKEACTILGIEEKDYYSAKELLQVKQ